MNKQFRITCPSKFLLGAQPSQCPSHQSGGNAGSAKEIYRLSTLLIMYKIKYATMRVFSLIFYTPFLLGCATGYPPPALSAFDLTRAQSTLQNAPQLYYHHRRPPEQWAMVKRVGERLVRTSQPICVDVAKRPCALELVLVDANKPNTFAVKSVEVIAPESKLRSCESSPSSQFEAETQYGCILKTYTANPRNQPPENIKTVVITTGLMNLIASDDELAALLGHEFAHHISGHISRAETRALVWYLVGNAIHITLKFAPQFIAASKGRQPDHDSSDSSEFAKNWREISDRLAVQNYGRSEELEADYIGAFLVARARYNLNSAVQGLAKLLRCSPQQPRCDQKSSTILDTHPSAAERIATWQKATARLRFSPNALPSTLAW